MIDNSRSELTPIEAACLMLLGVYTRSSALCHALNLSRVGRDARVTEAHMPVFSMSRLETFDDECIFGGVDIGYAYPAAIVRSVHRVIDAAARVYVMHAGLVDHTGAMICDAFELYRGDTFVIAAPLEEDLSAHAAL